MKPFKDKRSRQHDRLHEIGASGVAMGALLLVSLIYAASIL